MKKAEFREFRGSLGKTQKQFASLLGVSLKTIQSYEQGWRPIPPHIQRDLLYLLIKKNQNGNPELPCWELKGCTKKEQCPTWEFQSGTMCWYIHSTLCGDNVPDNYLEKLNICRSCEIFKSLL